MNRLEIAKQEEQSAFLRTLHEVLKGHNVEATIASVPQAIKFLRDRLRKGPSPLNIELARAVFLGPSCSPFLNSPSPFLSLRSKQRIFLEKQGKQLLDSGRMTQAILCGTCFAIQN